MFPGARDLQLCCNEARVCTTVHQAKQRVYTTNLKKCLEKFQFEIESLWKEKVKNLPSEDQCSPSVDKGQAPRTEVASLLYLTR